MATIDTVKNTNKVLGRGMNGTVYLVKDNKNNKYAFKIQQILPKDIKPSLSAHIWREIHFAKNVANKYPQHFMQLFDYKIDKSCKHKQSWKGFPFVMKDLPKAQQTYYKKLFASPYCSIKLWSVIDMTFDDLLKSWKTFHSDIYYDLMIQVMYIIYLINKEGYYHNDFHQGNIGIVKTDKKNITIMNQKIQTYGYLVQAIDYELNLNKKYKMKGWEEIKLREDNDIYSIVFLWCHDFADLKHFYKGIEIKEYEIIDIPKEEEELLSCYLQHLNLTKENHKFLMNILFKIIFYEKYERMILGDKFTKAIPPKLYLPLNVIIYMVKHIYEPEKILKYIIKNR